jgi:LysM repeat protein
MNMIDCATKLNAATCATLKANGITHVGRYLPTSDWKALSFQELTAIQQSDLQLVTIFENGSTKGSYFSKEQGIQDANRAYAMAKSLGQPNGAAIYFTVDFDAQVKDFANILNYFQGIKDTLKDYKIGIYGKYEVITLIQSKGLAAYYWQTYAWSSGQHAKNIHLFQYKNDTKQYGLPFGVDLNQVENGDCGAWGNKVQPVASKPPDVERTVHYTVQPGDNLTKIAEKFHTTVVHMLAINGWIKNPNFLDVGWEVSVPANGQVSIPKTQPYTIRSNENLTIIAKRFETTVDNLLHLNPQIKNKNLVYPGQVITVPIK